MREHYRIMVVDDEPIVREAIAEEIPWENYEIRVIKTAANAIEAMNYLQDNDVQLILVDIKMPVVDGIELIRRVRERNRTVEFIVISGYADFSYAQQALRLGARDYLLKPLSEVALLDAVKAARDEWEKRKLLTTAYAADGRNDSEAHDTGRRYSAAVSRILQIVDEEIANEELTLKWISSEKMYLNENYLSKRFQEEVKQRFTAYLFEHRMIMAMRLISRDPDALIQDVAKQTGFGDNAQYFSISFKKYTGYTPTEYKKRMLGDR